MMWPLLLFAATALVFALPLVPTLLELRRRTDVAPLAVGSGMPARDGDPGVLVSEGDVFVNAPRTFTLVRGRTVWFGPEPPESPLRRSGRAVPLALPRGAAGGSRGELRDGRWLVDGDLEFPAETAFRGDVIARGDVVVRRGATIAGSVKAHGELRIEPEVSIDGALVASSSVMIEGPSTVGGPVVSETEIRLGAGVVVGAPGHPASVVAPRVSVRLGVVVYGALRAGDTGTVRASGDGVEGPGPSSTGAGGLP